MDTRTRLGIALLSAAGLAVVISLFLVFREAARLRPTPDIAQRTESDRQLPDTPRPSRSEDPMRTPRASGAAAGAPAAVSLHPASLAAPVPDLMNLRFMLLQMQLHEDALDRQQALADRLRADPGDAEALAELLALGEEHRDLLDAWAELSRVEDPDFGVRWEEGIHALLKHLGPAAQAKRLLLNDAAAQLAGGDPDRAAAEVAAALRLADQIADPAVFCSLVSARWTLDAADVAAAVLSSEVLSPEARAELSAALSRFGTDDPFDFRAALRGEVDLVVQGMENIRGQLRSPEGLSDFITEFGYDHQTTVGFHDALHARGDFDANLTRHLDLYEAYMAAATEAWYAPDAYERLQRLETEAAEGRHGVLLVIFSQDLSGAHLTSRKAATLLDRLRALAAPPSGAAR